MSQTIDVYKELGAKNISLSNSTLITTDNTPVDLSWLRFAAKEYNISPDIKDYVITSSIIFPVGLPNRNGVAFSLADLTSFSIKYGNQKYRLWRACPTYLEHDHNDPLKANGVVLDVHLKKSSTNDLWKVMALMAFDRSKYKELVDKVISKELDSYSMGTTVSGYRCSVCDRPYGHCTHISREHPNRISIVEYQGRNEVAFRIAEIERPFEISIVDTPAWTIATNDQDPLSICSILYT